MTTSSTCMFADLPRNWGLKSGAVVVVTSDVSALLFEAAVSGGKFDANTFIDTILTEIGTDGTLLLPAFNFNFCGGSVFDMRRSGTYEGLLPKSALARSDFRRTRHPLYSFAVWGRHQDLLCEMRNEDSFGVDSPFAFLELMHATQVCFGVKLTRSFTYAHYIEQRNADVVPYRFIKRFYGKRIDLEGHEEECSCTMLVRRYELQTVNAMEGMRDLLLQKGLLRQVGDDLCPCLIIDDLTAAGVEVAWDIRHNRARNLVCYTGQ